MCCFLPSAHSQCESKNINTFPFASIAPFNRARIRPSRLLVRSNRTFVNGLISSSSGFFKCSNKKQKKNQIRYFDMKFLLTDNTPLSEKSSTSIISFNKFGGERSSTE